MSAPAPAPCAAGEVVLGDLSSGRCASPSVRLWGEATTSHPCSALLHLGNCTREPGPGRRRAAVHMGKPEGGGSCPAPVQCSPPGVPKLRGVPVSGCARLLCKSSRWERAHPSRPRVFGAGRAPGIAPAAAPHHRTPAPSLSLPAPSSAFSQMFGRRMKQLFPPQPLPWLSPAPVPEAGSGHAG